MNNKKLMVLGTNEALLNRAVEMGYEVHAFGLNPPDEKKTSKEKVIFHKQDILDYDSLWDACQRLKPQGVVSVCSELAMHPMHYLLRKMSIPCNSEETERATTDKYLMRKIMRDVGLDTPRFTLITPQSLEQEIKEQIRGFCYPLIVKPVDMSASRGVIKVESAADLTSAISYSLKWSKSKRCILEEFVEGPEYSGECVAYRGEYTLLAITKKMTTGAPHFVETSHRQPSGLGELLTNKVKMTLFKAFKALNIEYGAIHPEFRITQDGRILFMEIATRMGGDHIGTELTPLSSGYDFLGMVIDICCGKAPNIKRLHLPQDAEVRYIITQNDIDQLSRYKSDSSICIVRESEIGPIPESVNKSSDRAGYYILTRKKQ